MWMLILGFCTMFSCDTREEGPFETFEQCFEVSKEYLAKNEAAGPWTVNYNMLRCEERPKTPKPEKDED